MTWQERHWLAIEPGSDQTHTVGKFLHWLLVDPNDGVILLAKKDNVRKAIQAVADLFEKKMAGKLVTPEQWEVVRLAAAAAAYAAYADYASYASYAGAYAADAYAADAAAYAAAYAAYAAADAAYTAGAAAAAAYADARTKALAKCAVIMRKFYPTVPNEGKANQ